MTHTPTPADANPAGMNTEGRHASSAGAMRSGHSKSDAQSADAARSEKQDSSEKQGLQEAQQEGKKVVGIESRPGDFTSKLAGIKALGFGELCEQFDEWLGTKRVYEEMNRATAQRHRCQS